MRADGKHAPFRDDDEDKTDQPASGHDCHENRADSEKDIHKDMENVRESVSGASDKDIITCHINIL